MADSEAAPSPEAEVGPNAATGPSVAPPLALAEALSISGNSAKSSSSSLGELSICYTVELTNCHQHQTTFSPISQSTCLLLAD